MFASWMMKIETTEVQPSPGIQINRIFNIDIGFAIFQKINIDIDIARAINCHQIFNIDIAAR